MNKEIVIRQGKGHLTLLETFIKSYPSFIIPWCNTLLVKYTHQLL